MQDDRLIDSNGVIALLDSPEEIRAFWEQAQDEALAGMLASPVLSSAYLRHAAQFRRATVQLRALRKVSAPGAVPSPLPPFYPTAPGAPLSTEITARVAVYRSDETRAAGSKRTGANDHSRSSSEVCPPGCQRVEAAGTHSFTAPGAPLSIGTETCHD